MTKEMIAAFITIFGTVVSVTGVVIYVFNGTRKIIQSIDDRTVKMEERADRRHEEVVTLIEKMDNRIEKMDNRIEKMDNKFVGLIKNMHKEVISLMNKMTDLIDARLPAHAVHNPGVRKTKKRG